MRDIPNNDLKIEVEPQAEASMSSRKLPSPVKGDREQLAAGYVTLDQADTGPYASKERRGLSRDANYPRRY